MWPLIDFSDSEAEINLVKQACQAKNIKAIITDVYSQGGAGGLELAEEVVRICSLSNNGINFTYALEDSIEQKIEK